MGRHTLINLHYAAGIIDGEAFIGFKGTPVVTVSGCYRPTLVELQERWGGSVGIDKRTIDSPTKKRCYFWTVTGQKAATCLMQCIPFLREKRRFGIAVLRNTLRPRGQKLDIEPMLKRWRKESCDS